MIRQIDKNRFDFDKVFNTGRSNLADILDVHFSLSQTIGKLQLCGAPDDRIVEILNLINTADLNSEEFSFDDIRFFNSIDNEENWISFQTPQRLAAMRKELQTTNWSDVPLEKKVSLTEEDFRWKEYMDQLENLVTGQQRNVTSNARNQNYDDEFMS